jgi:hypothetical protein
MHLSKSEVTFTAVGKKWEFDSDVRAASFILALESSLEPSAMASTGVRQHLDRQL